MNTSSSFEQAGKGGRWMRSLVVVALGAAFSAMPAWAAPVTLNIVDVAGNLALTQDAIDNYVKKNPDKISKVTYSKAPAPELPGKLKAMQGAGRSDIDLVLTGTDVLAAGIEQGVLQKILPDQAAKFPESHGKLPGACGQDAGIGRRLRHPHRVLAGRSAGRVQPRQGQAAADDRRRIAGMVQGQSQSS